MKRPCFALLALLSSIVCVILASETARCQPIYRMAQMGDDHRLICPYRGPGLPLREMRYDDDDHPSLSPSPFEIAPLETLETLEPVAPAENLEATSAQENPPAQEEQPAAQPEESTEGTDEEKNASELLPNDGSNLPVLPDWSDTNEQNFYDESNTDPTTSHFPDLLESLWSNLKLGQISDSELGIRLQTNWLEANERIGHLIRNYNLDLLVERALQVSASELQPYAAPHQNDFSVVERDLLLGFAGQLDDLGSLLKLLSRNIQQAVVREVELQADGHIHSRNSSR